MTDPSASSQPLATTLLRVGVAILARKAELGKGKTRLAKTLGAEATLEIYLELIAKCSAAVQDSGLPARVYFDPAPGDIEVWSETYFDYGLQPTTPDLGARLAFVAADALSHFDAVLLIGTDCPYLDGQVLREAANALQACDALLGPSLDGGYYLLGIRAVHNELFQDIAWSTDQVAHQTRQVLTNLQVDEVKAGLNWQEISPLADIDEAQDWIDYCAWRERQ